MEGPVPGIYGNVTILSQPEDDPGILFLRRDASAGEDNSDIEIDIARRGAE